MVFRHDEIRDWHDNIRLDYGYALTIASAQGLTVDRAYLLADDRPARETIYPAATRHREGLDIYVNRAPLALAVAERRPEDQADRPVMDTDIRAHLADRWSRSQPKEAALDYITDWRDQREKAARRENGARAGERPGPAANDNAIVRIAGEIRRTALGWRHGAAVDDLAAGRAAVLAEYGEHREQIRAGGDSVALGAAFGQTLDRHGALLKVAEPFRARPRTFERLLAERGGIGRKELDGFEALYVRAREHRRVVALKEAHAGRREMAEPRDIEQQRKRGEIAPRAEPAAEKAPDEAPRTAVTAREAAWSAYEALKQDWSRHLAGAEQAGIHVIYIDGCEGLRARMEALTGNPDLADASRHSLRRVLGQLDKEAALRREVEAYLTAVEGKLKHRRDVLEIVADELRETVPGLVGYGEWRDEIVPLAETGRRIQAGHETYGIHLDSIALGGKRVGWALSSIRDALRKDDEHIAEQRKRERKSEGAVERQDTGQRTRKPGRRQRKGRSLSL